MNRRSHARVGDCALATRRGAFYDSAIHFMKSHLLATLALPLLLTQCVDPYYGPNAGPYGSGPNGSPYAPPYQQDTREQGAQLTRQAYERGWREGQIDAQQRQPQSYNRHYQSYDRNTEMAYRDGYDQGYASVSGSQGAAPPPVNNGGYTNPGTPPPVQRDPAYNQGYDYGLRDRTSGRVADPAAHVGRYDPRYRSSFERGYQDAFNQQSGGQTPANGTGSLWFR